MRYFYAKLLVTMQFCRDSGEDEDKEYWVHYRFNSAKKRDAFVKEQNALKKQSAAKLNAKELKKEIGDLSPVATDELKRILGSRFDGFYRANNSNWFPTESFGASHVLI